MDAGYEAGLKNIMTGISGCNIRKSMEEKMKSMEGLLEYPEYLKLLESMDDPVKAVEEYMEWINYNPLETQYFFNIIFDGHTRQTTG